MLKKWILSSRQRCDLEMLLLGGFHPLTGFNSEADYQNILAKGRLENNELWPMPITLDVDENFANLVELETKIGLYEKDNTLLAIMTVTDKWKPDKIIEAEAIFGTQDKSHPGVSYLFHQAGEWYFGGSLELVNLPRHYDFIEYRHSPHSLKQYLSGFDVKNLIGFQTRNPLHRAHMELTLRAAKEIDGHLLIHPVVGMTKPGDIDYYTRVRCCKKILPYYPQNLAHLSLLPLAMRMAGPKEALWHALIRKNYGCTHFIIGRDHAGSNDNNGRPFYDPYAAQTLVQKYQDEMGIKPLFFPEMVYVKERKNFYPVNEIQPDETALTVSGSQLRELLLYNQQVPSWFSFAEILEELKTSYPHKWQQGFTLFFTGLSGSGKTTLANALQSRLMSLIKKNVSILDGDVVRRILANELGFSKDDRNLNIKRIGFVASEITKAGGIAICAAIAPYQEAREANRELISAFGGYIEIYLSTPLETCEQRDTKGLYSKAKKGEMKGLTGLDDPYEVPIKPELTLDTTQLSVEESINLIIQYLQKERYLMPEERHYENSVA